MLKVRKGSSEEIPLVQPEGPRHLHRIPRLSEAPWDKVQPLLLTLDEGYLLTSALPDFQHGIAPLGLPAPVQPLLLGHGVLPISEQAA